MSSNTSYRKELEPKYKDFKESLKESGYDDIPQLTFSYSSESYQQSFDARGMSSDIYVDIFYPYDDEGRYDSSVRNFIGSMHLCFINMSSCKDHNIGLQNVITDDYDRLLLNRVFDYEKDGYRYEWSDDLDRLQSRNVLYLESIYLSREFRNCCIGKAILKEFQVRFYGIYGYMITAALPMQHDISSPDVKGWEWENVETDNDRTEAQFFRFLRKIGFQQHQDSKIFFAIGSSIKP